MTPKQKKVSLNAAILRTITGNIAQLSYCLSNLREANPPQDMTAQELNEAKEIRRQLTEVRFQLQELEPKFRKFAKFDPEPKWKRKIRKSDPQFANECWGERNDS